MQNMAHLNTLFQEMIRGRLSRREFMRRAAALGLTGPAMALLAACGGGEEPTAAPTQPAGAQPTPTPAAAQTPAAAATPTAAGEPRRGGTLRIALIGEPPTLDIHQTTATIVTLTTTHMYEPLFTWDEHFQIIPDLAESHEVSDDGLTIVVRLRQGVPFHNGEEMKAADVIASIERWGQISGLGKNLMDATEKITEVDDYTVEFKMKRPFGTFTTVLARQNQGCFIYPKSLIDKVGTEPIQDGFIGTGPYRFVERQADRFIRMERFEDYAARSEPPNGYGGRKNAYVDEIMFIPVPDEAARIAGLQAGDYHYLESIIPDQFQTLKDDPNVVAEILPPTSWATFVLNTKSPLMGNVKIRQAVQAALNHEEMMLASAGEGFFRLDPSVMLKETAWYSTVGAELYDRRDPETARRLLEEAGYDGTPVRFMTTQEYQDQYNNAVVGKQQLEAAGFVIDLQVYDWATVVERRSNPELWDIFTTGITFRPDPVMLPFMQGTRWPGFWDSEQKVALTEQLQSESDFETRFQIWEQIQQLFYEEVPLIKIGDEFNISARSPKIKNFPKVIQISPPFWNVWLEE